MRFVPVRWRRTWVSQDDRRLRLLWTSGDRPLHHVCLHEGAREIVATLFEAQAIEVHPWGEVELHHAIASMRCVEIPLSSPVGTRVVLDGSPIEVWGTDSGGWPPELVDEVDLSQMECETATIERTQSR